MPTDSAFDLIFRRAALAGEPNPVDVAFKSAEQDSEAKVSTLKRLMGALKKL